MGESSLYTFNHLFSEFWLTSNTLTAAILFIQLLLSGVCIVIFLIRISSILRVLREEERIVQTFWGAENLTNAMDALATERAAKWHNMLAYHGISAVNWRQQQQVQGLKSTISLSDWIRGHLRMGHQKAKKQMNQGIELLKASIPIVVMLGLFGTLWQIAVILSQSALQDLNALLAAAMFPILVGLVLAILLWMGYSVFKRLSNDFVSCLDNFKVDLRDYLITELNRSS